MSSSKRAKAKRFMGSREAVERALERIDMSSGAGKTTPKKTTVCRAPSCNKLVPVAHTRNGYCLACVKKAIALKKKREQAELEEALELELGVNHKHFGAF